MAPVASLEEEEAAMAALHAEIAARAVQLPPGMVFAGDEEATLLRFLRARKLDIEATMSMIQNCILWRQECSVEQILISPMSQDKIDVIRRHRPSSYVGFDKQGRPVFVDRPGMTDYDKIWGAGCTDDDIWKLHVAEMEYMSNIMLPAASKRNGHTVDSVTVIMDMSGLSMRHFTKQTRELFTRIVTTDSDNYPETNAGTYIVNASWVFVSIWKLVSHLVDARTRAKVQVLGSKDVALPILRQVIDDGTIPDFLGGELKFDDTRSTWAETMDKEVAAFSERIKGSDESGTGNAGTPGPVAPGHRSGSFISRSLSRIKRTSSKGSVDDNSDEAVATSGGSLSKRIRSASKRRKSASRNSSREYVAHPEAAKAADPCSQQAGKPHISGGQHTEQPQPSDGLPTAQVTSRSLPSSLRGKRTDEQDELSSRPGDLSITLSPSALSAINTSIEDFHPEVHQLPMDPEVAATIARLDILIAKVRAKSAGSKTSRTGNKSLRFLFNNEEYDTDPVSPVTEESHTDKPASSNGPLSADGSALKPKVNDAMCGCIVQ